MNPLPRNPKIQLEDTKSWQSLVGILSVKSSLCKTV